jgi:anti-sigma-K factor RskA
MNDRLHIADTDLTLYAMGALSAAEVKPVEAHLLECARCNEELRQNTLALAAYAQTTPEVEMPAGSKDRFMARLAATPQTATAAAEKTVPAKVVPAKVVTLRVEEPVSLWRRIFGSGWSPVLAGAFALLLLVVGIDDMQKRTEIGPLLEQAQHGAIDSAQLSQLMELLTSPQAKRVALHPGPVTAPPPEGRVTYAARTGKLLLTASNLHALPAGKTYELWILQPNGKAPLPAGTFVPDASGNATMILANAPAGLAVQGFGVTIENAGGSQTPTLPIVLSGL